MVAKPDRLGVYVSIPFCKAKCTFCNFASGVFAPGRMQGYVDRLCEEIQAARALAGRLEARLPHLVDSVYFGGGTPSLLEPAHFDQIFAALRGEFTVQADAEITLEAAPGQMAQATLRAAMRLGVNRVSFGVQSFVDAEAAAVGRLHTAAQAKLEIARMKNEGMRSVGLDLIVGLPYQTSESWTYSVSEAIASGVDHVSVYLLEVDEDSRLGREALAGGNRFHAAALPSEDAGADWYAWACAELARAGLVQYEISNFAREGCASRHNLKYWRRQPYLGFGLDAHSMLLSAPSGREDESVAVRWANASEFDEYLGRGVPGGVLSPDQELKVLQPASPTVHLKQSPREPDRIGMGEAFEEALFLGLRLNGGVDLKRLGREFGQERLGSVQTALREVESAGLLVRRASHIQLTEKGRLASNEVFSRLLVA